MKNFSIFTYQPKDAQDANRLARTEEFARQILTEGYTFEADVEASLIYVTKPGRLASAYEIDTDDMVCNCPDFAKRGTYCKHIIAAQIDEFETAQVEKMEAYYQYGEGQNW